MKSFPYVPQHVVVDTPDSPEAGYYRIYQKTNGSLYHSEFNGNNNPLIQGGGNAVGAKIIVGTTDNQDFEVQTNGLARFLIQGSGVGYFNNNLNIGSDPNNKAVVTGDRIMFTNAGVNYLEFNKDGFKRYGSDGFSITATIVSGTLVSNKTQVIPNKSGTYVLDVDLAAYALDNTVVHLAGVETVTGVKTFTGDPLLANLKILKFGGNTLTAGDYLTAVASSATLTLNIADSTNWNSVRINTATDIGLNNGTDKITLIGRGSIFAGVTNNFTLAYGSTATNTNYLIRQNSSGGSVLNAATGQAISFAINGSAIGVMNAASLTFSGTSYLVQAPTYNVLDSDGSTWRTALTNSGATNGLYVGSGFTTTTVAFGSTLRIPATVQMFDSAGTARAFLVSTSAATLTMGGSYTGMTVAPVTTFNANVIIAGTGLVDQTVNFASATAANSYGFRTSATITGTSGATGYSASFSSVNTINQTAGALGDIYSFNASPTMSSVSTGRKYVGFFSNVTTGVTGGGQGYSNYHAGSASSFFNHRIQLGSAQGIADSNGIFIIAIPTLVSSATNYFGINNSASTNDISIGAHTNSGDTNVSISYFTKGTGTHKFTGGVTLVGTTNIFQAPTYNVLDSDGTTWRTALTNSGTTGGLFIGSGFTTTSIKISGSNQFNFASGNFSYTNGVSIQAFSITAGQITLTNGAMASSYGFASTSGFNYAFLSSGTVVQGSSTADAGSYIANNTINQTSGSNQIAMFSALPAALTSVTGRFVGYYSNISGTAPTGGGTTYAMYHAGTATSFLGGQLQVSGLTTLSSQLIGNASSNFTAGTQYWWRNAPVISATAGAFNVAAYTWESSINQSGGTGLIMGIYLTPTITSVTGTLAGIYSNINTTPTGGGTAYAIYMAGTAVSYFGGGVWASSLRNDGQFVIGAASELQFRDATGTAYTRGLQGFSYAKGANQTAATPTYGFGNSTGDGMYLISSNNIGWSTAGTLRLTLASTGLTIAGSTTVMQSPIYNVLDSDGVTWRSFAVTSGTSQQLLFANGFTSVTTPVTSFIFGGGSTNIDFSTGNPAIRVLGSGGALSLQVAGGATANNGVTITTTATMTNSSNNRNGVLVAGNYTVATSGAGTFQGVRVRPTLTLSSTANQIMALIELWPSIGTLTAGSTLYGLRSRIDTDISGAATWNIYADGTAPNYLKGKLTMDDDIEYATGKSDIVKDTVTGTRYRIVVTSGVVTAILA